MEMYIGANIKRLRQQKNVTQEKLAEHLGVSTQAVSKWERNETYPDITMVLPLASYFGISADELLGLDEAKNQQKIEEYLAESRELYALGDVFRRFDLVEQAYKEFPNDFRIMADYIYVLCYDPNLTQDPCGAAIHQEELKKLCERILRECNLDKPRYTALNVLSEVYSENKDFENADRVAARFPETYYDTKNEVLQRIHWENPEKWLFYVQDNLKELAYFLHNKISGCATEVDTDPQNKIRILQKAIDLIHLIYDDKDYGFANYQLGTSYWWMSYNYIKLQQYEIAFKHMEKSLAHMKQYDQLPVRSQHTSFLVNKLVFDKMETSSSTTQNTVSAQLETMERYYSKSEISQMEQYKALVEKYRPFASETKGVSSNS